MGKESSADALATEGGTHEEVLEIEAVPAEKGGEIVEPQGEACRLAPPLGDVAEDARIGTEERRAEIALGRLHLVGQLLVFGKLAHECRDEAEVGRLCRTDDEGHLWSSSGAFFADGALKQRRAP